jgi:hypothetical protein
LKHPEWLVLHGVNLIFGGIGSFSFHSSFTVLGHFLDIMSILPMLGYPTSYSISYLFLEELNRMGVSGFGDISSEILSYTLFLGNLGFGAWLSYTRYFNLTYVIIGMSLTLLGTMFIKVIKEYWFGR